MRQVTVNLAGTDLTLRGTFAASVEIADRVADPILIARESMIEQMMLDSGMPYTPKFAFTVKNLPVILEIGMKAAGENMSRERLQELIFEAGFGAARDAAVQYLSLIVGPAPEEMPKEGGKSGGN